MWASAPATVRPLSPILRCASSRRRRCARGAQPNRRRLPVLAPAILGAADAELFERLRALRLRLAQEAAVPPYVIFHDATLAAMAAARPATEEELLALPRRRREKARHLRQSVPGRDCVCPRSNRS